MRDNHRSESNSESKLNTSSLLPIPSLPPLPSSRKRGHAVAATTAALTTTTLRATDAPASTIGTKIGSNSNNYNSLNGISIPSLPVFNSKLSSQSGTCSINNDVAVTTTTATAVDNDSNKENKVNSASSSSSSVIHSKARNRYNKNDGNSNNETSINIPTSTLDHDASMNTDHTNTNTNSTTNSINSSANNASNSFVYSNSTPSTSISASLSTSSPSLHTSSRQTIINSPSPPTTNSISPFPTTKSSLSPVVTTTTTTTTTTSLATVIRDTRDTPNVIRNHRLQSRVLRSGETIESFFCLIPAKSKSEYDTIKSICYDIVHDINSSKNDIQKWKQVLDYIYHAHNVDGNDGTVNDDTLKEKNLLRLYKRATSRFGTSIPHQQEKGQGQGQKVQVGNEKDNGGINNDEYKKRYEKDLVEMWLQYAKVQYKFNHTTINESRSGNSANSQSNGTKSIFQLLRHKNLGQMLSIYYIAMADYELGFVQIDMEEDNEVKGNNGKEGDRNEQYIQKAKSIIENGVRVGAKPLSLLNNYMEKIEGFKKGKYYQYSQGCYGRKKPGMEEGAGGPGVGQGCEGTTLKEDEQGRNPKIATSSLSTSNYRSRPKKRSPITSLMSRAKIKRCNSIMKGSAMGSKLPRRILAVDDDEDEENTDDGKDNASSDSLNHSGDNDSNDSIDNVVDNRIIRKHPKVSFLDKEPQKITKDSISYLLNWDPTQRQVQKPVESEDNEKTFGSSSILLSKNTSRKSRQPMQKIEENTQENSTNNNGNSSSTNTSSATGDSNNLCNNSENHSNSSNTSATNTSASTRRSSNGSLQNNSVDNLQNNAMKDEPMAKEDDPRNTTVATRTLNQSMSDISQLVLDKQNTSSSSSLPLQKAMDADPDFLPLINKGRILAVNNMKYLKLGVIGKGGSCKVYRALASNSSHSIVAIKKVKLAGMAKKSIEGYVNEISLLRRLRDNPAIIQLYDSQVDFQRKVMYLVMEAGEVDLNHVVRVIFDLINYAC